MGTKKGRFDSYEPFSDLGQPDKVGLLPNDSDFDLGTPNLTRNENVTLIAANSSLDRSLLLNIKWRPDSSGQFVTTISRLTFKLDQSVYESEQIEHYQPHPDSCIKPGRILTYGSSSSKLKLLIMSPYRRARITFNGHMRLAGGKVESSDPNHLVYIKLSCLVLPISNIFDFQGQVDENCLRQIYAEKKLTRSFESTVADLLQHDRHEQRVRLNGEFLLIDKANQSAIRRQETFEVRGHHARHFLTVGESKSVTRRLYGFVNNGQGFHIGTRALDKESIDFGYTAFHPHPRCDFIDKPFKLLGELGPNLEKFDLEISGHECTFECKGERGQMNWFKLEFNGKPGWAYMSLDDELEECERESLAMTQCRQELEAGANSGKICDCTLEGLTLEGDNEPTVVSIDDDCCSSSRLVGAKAASLAQLCKFVTKSDSASRYVVPKALVLTRYAYDLILKENNNLTVAISELKQLIGRRDLSELREKCREIQDLIASTKLPQQISVTLSEMLNTKRQFAEGGEDGDEIKFAVRSSSWGEDETDMSAAGQLTTVLNVGNNPDELAKAAMVCFASKFSAENIEYKRQHGQPLDLPMAVVIQRMIACDKAGVMFTCDPMTGDESLVTITANYGLGESVVSAQADPDSIRVLVKVEPRDYSLVGEEMPPAKRSLSIDEIKVGKKEVVIGGDGAVQPSDQDRSKCCLSDEEILELAKCGLDIKQYFWSQRRDIEWGFKEGRLHLFQSRPVTGLESYTQEELLHEFDRCAAAELNYYTRANIGEVMPHAIKPLTLSFIIGIWNIIGYRLLAKFLPYKSEFVPQVALDFTYEYFHALFNCRNSMFLSLDDEKKSVVSRSLEIGLFGREVGPQPEIAESSRGFPRAPQPFQGFRFKLNTWQLRLMPVRTVEKELDVMIKLRQDIRALKLAKSHESNKALGLYNQMCSAMNSSRDCWINHIVMIFMGTESNLGLTGFLSKYIKDPMQLCAASNRFLAIATDVVSAEIPERISKMAKLIGAISSDEARTFASLTPENALSYILDGTVQSRESLREAFREFMDKFGHRCYNEFEIAARAWREEPTQVVEMIQKNCVALTSKGNDSDETTKDTRRDRTMEDVFRSLNLANLTFKDKIVLKNLIAPKSQLCLSLREKTKNILVMFHDIIRECSRMLAAELVRTERIPDGDLLYYVSFDELKPLVLDYQPTIVMQATRRRQLFKKMFGEIWKFDEIFTEVIPNHLKPTKELDEAIARAPKLLGTPASSGKVQGRICKVEGYKELDKVRPGTILLTHSTDIAFSPVFPLISGIITEVGGLVSHGAVVAREYGLPSLIGIPDVTRIPQDDEEIILDADNGTIIRLSLSQTDEK